MTFLDVCAGIGGFSLGLERAGMVCAGQVEIDDHCTRILAKHWPHVPRWGDITTLDPAALSTVDLVCGGYPCQPFSLAGKRKGARDDRHLWPVIREIVAHIRPTWCLFENVAGHISMGLDAVLSDLEGLSYATGPLVIPACAVDAKHRRDRVWIVAHAEVTTFRPGLCQSTENRDGRRSCNSSGEEGDVLSHTHSAGRQEQHLATVADRKRHGAGRPHAQWHQWAVEPSVGRVAHGIPRRVDRIKALGNAVVPQVVEEIGRAIMAAHYGGHHA